MFTAGSGYLMVHNWLTHPLSPGGTLTIQMYLSMTKAKYDDAFGIAFVLIIIVLAINLLTKVLSRKLDVNKEK